MDYTQIILKPLVTEKATYIKDTANQVAFLVHPSANKLQVKKAVEDAFKVKVDSVNMIKRKPLARTKWGRTVGRISGFKKAYVTLAAGEKIEIFEGV